MAWHPHALIEEAVLRLAEEQNLPIGQVTAILGEFVKVMHEVTYKAGPSTTLLGIRFTLGDEATWHFFGTIYCAYTGIAGETLRDARSSWNETALWLDSELGRFRPIVERWEAERLRAERTDGATESHSEDLDT